MDTHPLPPPPPNKQVNPYNLFPSVFLLSVRQVEAFNIFARKDWVRFNGKKIYISYSLSAGEKMDREN
jgi:hypothetical protein